MRTVDLYVLTGRKYRAIEAIDGRLRSTVLDGFYLRDAWLFRKSLPKVATVLKEFASGQARRRRRRRRGKARRARK